MDLLERILEERPKFHRGEVEITREFSANESSLSEKLVDRLTRREPVCWGIDREVASFLYACVNSGSKTLETGSGISTLVFALKGSNHVAVTPSEGEVRAIKEYANKMKIDLSKITFVVEQSEKYLPICGFSDLDLVLIDGKHAFPWPVLDWFYTADRLKKGGLMMIDDIKLHSVGILKEFMSEDPRWRLHHLFGNRTCVFEKIADSAHDVTWHMQPFVSNRMPKKGLIQNAGNRLRRWVRKRIYNND
jgi:predicted O-methyltransferase YrrM